MSYTDCDSEVEYYSRIGGWLSDSDNTNESSEKKRKEEKEKKDKEEREKKDKEEREKKEKKDKEEKEKKDKEEREKKEKEKEDEKEDEDEDKDNIFTKINNLIIKGNEFIMSHIIESLIIESENTNKRKFDDNKYSGIKKKKI